MVSARTLPELSGRVAFGAGASRGIGAHIARALARQGAAVAVAARTEQPRRVPGTINTVAAEIVDAGGTALPVSCDVRDEGSVEAAVAQTVATFGHLDVLVVNAGVMWLQPTLETPLDRWHKTLLTNLTAAFIV